MLFFFWWKLESNTSLPHFCIYFYRLQVGYFIYIQFERKDIILVLVFPNIHADGNRFMNPNVQHAPPVPHLAPTPSF